MVGLGSGSYSIVLNPNDPDKVDIFCRSRSQLEDEVEARKIAERDRDLREKAALAAAITKTAKQLQKGQQRQFQRATGAMITRQKRPTVDAP